MQNKITKIYATEILDSRGDPTLAVTVEAGEFLGMAKVPSGASTGKTEAFELRDNDADRFGGKGVLKAILNVNGEINRALIGQEADKISHIDDRLINLDGTVNKSRLGANAILGVSMAAAKVGAKINNLPLYRFINQYYKFRNPPNGLAAMPVSLTNLINGGKHANSNLDFQEFWVIPQNISSFRERTRAVSEIFHCLGELLKQNGYDTDLGNEGGYAPDFKDEMEPWKFLSEAVREAGYNLGKDVFFGLDAGSSSFYNELTGKYDLKMLKRSLCPEELSLIYEKWLAEFPFLALEDPFSEDDWPSWQTFNQKLKSINPDILLIGDDLFTTNVSRLNKGIELDAANAVLIKPNQIGTVTETVACVKMANANKMKIAVSHRSGETEDDFIADFAVGVNSEYVKIGSTARSERIAKYNRLMEIEDEIMNA